MNKKERFERIIAYFSENMPEAETELEYRDPYELIVAVILSAQCTDKRVNRITPGFFEKYPDVHALARAGRDGVFELIKSCSYPNNKTSHLLGMARMLVDRFDGKVPAQLDLLQELPGIGRKSANVILSVAFREPAMAVDTHVFRVAARLGLTTGARNPYQAEMQLIRHIPRKKVHLAHHWLILHGRYVCKARKPECHRCGITGYCRYYARQESNRTKRTSR